ncbi:ArsR family transcriptional regulator [Candidatus Woesearchaeota archaeon]|nr:MAG: ArsR family transcriptional regulator [Candidatus Woesearchaeota archaeon]
MHQKIILRSMDKPSVKDTVEDINWLCDSFGFSTGRDIERFTAKTLITLLRRISREAGVASEELARDLHTSPARVNYHVRSLMDSGFLVRERRRIFLRAGSMKAAVEEVRKDANRIFDDLALIAQEIDSAMGIKHRE